MSEKMYTEGKINYKITKPHGVTFCNFILNKLKYPLHITHLGLVYMRTRVIELRIQFLKDMQ